MENKRKKSNFQEINKHIREREKSKKIEDDWKFSALVSEVTMY